MNKDISFVELRFYKLLSFTESCCTKQGLFAALSRRQRLVYNIVDILDTNKRGLNSFSFYTNIIMNLYTFLVIIICTMMLSRDKSAPGQQLVYFFAWLSID
jgi:hypothetical protein